MLYNNESIFHFIVLYSIIYGIKTAVLYQYWLYTEAIILIQYCYNNYL